MNNNGIFAKVWNINSASVKKSTNAQLLDSIGYILNDEKTDCVMSMEHSIINDPLGQLGRECKYVEDAVKTVSGAYVGGQNLISSDIKDAVAEMMEVKKFFEKKDGRAALHGVISLSESESGMENASKLMLLCESVLKDVFPEHQAVFAVHTNTDNLHVHFIINSVGLNGRKIHQNDKFIKEVLHPCINKYAKRLGLTPNEKWEKDYEDAKTSYVEQKIAMRKAIDYAIEKSDDFNEFVQNMRKDGVSVNVGKYISVKTNDMGKAIRTHNLGVSYTKDSIVERIVSRKQRFEDVSLNNYVIPEKAETVFAPVISEMKKYKDMNPKQKSYVLKQLKLGHNPWREHRQMNWQLNNIADQLNLQERIAAYVQFYSSDGTMQGTMDGIIEAKKRITAEKRIIASQKRKYKPILDIYEEMQPIQRKAYLYEHENITEYRAEFEQYRILTKRLKNGYNKDVIEVANFLQECDERILYAHAQLQELSEEYREIKKYSLQHGNQLKQSGSLIDMIGIFSTRNDEKNGIFQADAYYIASKNSDIFMRIIQTPTITPDGKLTEEYEVTLIAGNGKVMEKLDNKNGFKDFAEQLKKIEKKYDLKDCKKFSNYKLAYDYTQERHSVHMKSDSEEQSDMMSEFPVMSFTQAINHFSERKTVSVVVDPEMTLFTAMAMKGKDNLKITVFDKDNHIQESITLPFISNKTDEGYGKIVNLQKKYGFSDAVLAFENVSDARTFMNMKADRKDNVRKNRS